MASFVYAFLSLANAASMHCSVRPEISPCTCEAVSQNHMGLSCEKVDSFHQIVNVLSNKFTPDTNVHLKITHSQLEDLEMRLFKDLNVNIVKLRMQWNKLRSIPELPFRGLENVEYLSFGDNLLEEIPKHALNHMPRIKTLDIARCRIRAVLQEDFRGTQNVTYLFLPDNNITRLDKGAFPPNIVTLHLGRNQIQSLNGTIRDLNLLESLFINANNLTSLEDELPEDEKLKLIMAHNNRLEKLPQSMKHMEQLETVHLQFNALKSFDGIFQKAKYLSELISHNNEIEHLAKDEFLECNSLEILDMGVNNIRYLNSSLLPLAKLRTANFSFNRIQEFALHEISGLKSLKEIYLSNNEIEILSGHYEGKTGLLELRLDHNRITSLNDSLVGLYNLKHLHLSYNKIERVFPYNFGGLENLETLDLSHNSLLTLADLEFASLPKLSTLMVQYNNLTSLESDFYGLPVLCFVNLTSNYITSISEKLVLKTRCVKHGVADTLQIHLDDNPIMCDERLRKLCTILGNDQARIRGRSQCFENDQEVCTVLRMLFKTPYDGLDLINGGYVIMPTEKIIFKPMTSIPSLRPTTTTTTPRPAMTTTTSTTSTSTTSTSTSTTTTTTTTPKPSPPSPPPSSTPSPENSIPSVTTLSFIPPGPLAVLTSQTFVKDAGMMKTAILDAENQPPQQVEHNLDGPHQMPYNETHDQLQQPIDHKNDNNETHKNNEKSTGNSMEILNPLDNSNSNTIHEMPPNFIKIEDNANSAIMPNAANRSLFNTDNVNENIELNPTMSQKEYIAIEYIPNNDFKPNQAAASPNDAADDADDAKTNFVEVLTHLENTAQAFAHPRRAARKSIN